jgi:hypothetical protein
VKPLWDHFPNWLAGNPLVWRVLDAIFRRQGRQHLARIDRPGIPRAQNHILLRLVRRATTSPFGLLHDFPRIRTLEDYQRLVPLRSPGELESVRSSLVLPPSGSGLGEGFGALPELLNASFREAVRTGLALARHSLPRTRLLSGYLLSCNPDWIRFDKKTSLLEHVPSLVRPWARTAVGPDRHGNDDPIGALAELHARDEVTTLIGPEYALLGLIERVKRIRGQEHLERVWPRLSVALCTQDDPGSFPVRLQEEASGRLLVLPLLFRPEGPLAVLDPRVGRWRLLTDHGVFFEFVRAGDAGTRLSLNQVRPGFPYELAITSPAGLWACRTGVTVTFEQIVPPLLSGLSLHAGLSAETSTLVSRSAGFPPSRRSGHRQSVGSRAARSGSSIRSPW